MDPLVVINALTETDIMDHLLNHIGQPGVLRSLMAVAQVLKTQASEWDENMEQSAIGWVFSILNTESVLQVRRHADPGVLPDMAFVLRVGTR